jgi:hypothetical protein
MRQMCAQRSSRCLRLLAKSLGRREQFLCFFSIEDRQRVGLDDEVPPVEHLGELL